VEKTQTAVSYATCRSYRQGFCESRQWALKHSLVVMLTLVVRRQHLQGKRSDPCPTVLQHRMATKESNATDDIPGSRARSAPSSPPGGEDFGSKNLTEERSLPNPSIPLEEALAASDNNVTTRLWEIALNRLSNDKSKQKILDKYKELAMQELVNSGLAPNRASPPDLQRVEDWLKKSESPSSKGGEILDNVAKALSFAAQVLAPAAIEPHIGLVYAGLCILTQVGVQIFWDYTFAPSLPISDF
jgi:hypothetical protein